MSENREHCRGGRLAARRPRRARVTTAHGTRMRVSSDAVVSAYINDISRPGGGAAERERTAGGDAAERERTIEFV